MGENYNQSDKSTPKLAIVSLYLGICSIFVLLLSIMLGFLVESIGNVSFFGVVSVLALAAIVCGIIARQKIATEKFPGKRTANTGLILGLIALFLIGLMLSRQADDDKVCKAKYGELWDQYTEKVKYKIIPFIY